MGKLIGYVMVVAGIVVLLKYGLAVTGWIDPPVKEFSSNQARNEFKEEYKSNMKALLKLRKQGEISDGQFALGSMHEQALLEYRTRIAANPVSTACESSVEIKGQALREYPLPSVCGTGFTFEVWFEGPHRVIRAEWVTFNGGVVMQGSPRLKAGYKSLAKALGHNRWEVEGNVAYEHDHMEDTVKLRITVE